MTPSGCVDCRVSRSGDSGWVVVGYSVSSDLTAAMYYTPHALCYLCRCPDPHPVQTQSLRTLKLPVPLYLRLSALRYARRLGPPGAGVGSGPAFGTSKPTSPLGRRRRYLASAWVFDAEKYADRLGAALRLTRASLGRSGRVSFKQPQSNNHSGRGRR
jgi:hypothetical protein